MTAPDTWDTRAWTFLETRRDGATVTVTINRNDGRNALCVALMTELTQAARLLAHDTSIHAVILTGKTVFTAGADLKDPKLRDRADLSLLELRQALRIGPDMCQAWEDLEQFTIAAIEGYCIGGGVALAVACDMRIMAESGVLRLPEVALGMNMSWHTLPRLNALIGPSRTKQLTIFAENVSCATAQSWGLIDDTAKDGGTLERAKIYTDKIERLPPVAVRMSKQAVNAAAHALNYATTYMDRDQFALTAQSKDYREAINAFLERREPKFRGQ